VNFFYLFFLCLERGLVGELENERGWLTAYNIYFYYHVENGREIKLYIGF